MFLRQKGVSRMDRGQRCRAAIIQGRLPPAQSTKLEHQGDGAGLTVQGEQVGPQQQSKLGRDQEYDG